MSLITGKPEGLDSGNDLDKLPDDLLQLPPAYYTVGATPEPLTNPIKVGETRKVVALIKCMGQSDNVRDDGEHRYMRKCKILWLVESGQPEPPDTGDDQPALLDNSGQPTSEATGADDGEIEDLPEDDGTDPEQDGDDDVDNVARVDFSHGADG